MRAWPVGMAAVLGAALGGAVVGWSVRSTHETVPPADTTLFSPLPEKARPQTGDGLVLAVAEEEAPDTDSESDTEAAGEKTQLISDENAVRRVIERDLADASAEERDIWFEEMKKLPPAVVEDLLRVRRQFPQLRSIHPELLAPQRPNRLPDGPVEALSPATDSPWPATSAAMDHARRVALHNIANAETPGYRRLMILTSAVSFHSDEEPGSRLLEIRLDLSPGPRIATERSLDLKIQGPGWFVVDVNGQPAYTRFGGLVIDADHKLAIPTPAGRFVVSPGISIPEDVVNVHCAMDGTVLVQHPGEAQPSQLGRIAVAQFLDDASLEVGADGLYRPTVRSGPSRPVMLGDSSEHSAHLIPFCLEGSNVAPTAEFSTLERVDRWRAAHAAAQPSGPRPTIAPTSVVPPNGTP